MHDPGNPRAAFEESHGGADPAISVRPELGVVAITRIFCLLASFGVLLVAIYYAIHVFGQVGHLITDPQSAQPSVDAIAKMIDTENLKFTSIGGDNIAPGRLLAFLLLIFCYVIWFWIPMTMIRIAGQIILRSLPERDAAKK